LDLPDTEEKENEGSLAGRRKVTTEKPAAAAGSSSHEADAATGVTVRTLSPISFMLEGAEISFHEDNTNGHEEEYSTGSFSLSNRRKERRRQRRQEQESNQKSTSSDVHDGNNTSKTTGISKSKSKRISKNSKSKSKSKATSKSNYHITNTKTDLITITEDSTTGTLYEVFPSRAVTSSCKQPQEQPQLLEELNEDFPLKERSHSRCLVLGLTTREQNIMLQCCENALLTVRLTASGNLSLRSCFSSIYSNLFASSSLAKKT
jgi:hypothetical protein